jgi:hypothetical protein
MTSAPEDLMAAFWFYERALMVHDVPALDRLFADSPDTLRGDAAGVLVGYGQISAFRGLRGGTPQHQINTVHVRVIDSMHALIVSQPGGGARSRSRPPRPGSDLEGRHHALLRPTS